MQYRKYSCNFCPVYSNNPSPLGILPIFKQDPTAFSAPCRKGAGRIRDEETDGTPVPGISTGFRALPAAAGVFSGSAAGADPGAGEMAITA